MLSNAYSHPEERPKGASRRTQDRDAALRLNSCPASFENAVSIAPTDRGTLHRLPVRSTGSACGREGRPERRCGRARDATLLAFTSFNHCSKRQRIIIRSMGVAVALKEP